MIYENISVEEALEVIPSIPAQVQLTFKYGFKTDKLPVIRHSRTVYQLLLAIWDKDLTDTLEHRESFIILLLNRANCPIGWSIISQGGASSTTVDPKMIFQTALLHNAASIIISHNHPSGNNRPSESDRVITKKLVEAGKLMDLPVLDHVIVNSNSYYSFADEGEL